MEAQTQTPIKQASAHALVSQLKNAEQDYEWYPTTDSMLAVIRADIVKNHQDRFSEHEPSVSVLDCGAGTGQALTALAGEHGEKYSIEKSPILIGQQPNDVIPVGTDFDQSTLIDKKVQVIFSNPPYSKYENWATKIINEANALDVYLVIPERWESSPVIKEALESRKAEAEVIHTDDFLEGERKARAKVAILHVDLTARFGRSYHRRGESAPDTDPFTLWFEETFAPKTEEKANASNASGKAKTAAEHAQDAIKREMVTGKNLIEALVALYNRDMGKLQRNYAAACNLDPSLMVELGIKHEELAKAIKQKIKGLKNKYWREFFANYGSITERLTSASRKQLLNTLHKNTAVEFTAENAYAVTLWVIRNANQYYDSQLIDLVESMVRQANVSLYKSNQRTFKAEDWRYNSWCEKAPKGLRCYKLEYRIVLDRVGGVCTSSWEHERREWSGLTERAFDFVGDVLAVAKTLGWCCQDTPRTHGDDARFWESNKKQAFVTEKGQTLMEVRAFKNGNMHIKFHQEFMKKLNVEFGRLMGWLKDKTQAAEELNIKPEEAAEFFCSTFKITPATTTLLLTAPGADVAEVPKAEAPKTEPPIKAPDMPATNAKPLDTSALLPEKPEALALF